MEKAMSRAALKIVQLEPWLEPAWLGLITTTFPPGFDGSDFLILSERTRTTRITLDGSQLGWEEILLFSVFIIVFFSQINPVFCDLKPFFRKRDFFSHFFFFPNKSCVSAKNPFFYPTSIFCGLYACKQNFFFPYSKTNHIFSSNSDLVFSYVITTVQKMHNSQEQGLLIISDQRLCQQEHGLFYQF